MHRPDPGAGERKVRMLGAPTNSKLGRLIHTFSIPALETCPGASAVCKTVCYALNGHFRQGNVKRRHAANLERTRDPSFVGDMIAELQANYVRVLRIHVAGDFYDSNYISKWIEIARACPRITFFSYTRSWAVPELLPRLKALAKLPNFQLWLSVDRSMSKPPAIPGTRTAFLAANEDDEELVPASVDLVFREEVTSIKKHINTVQVCPHENGMSELKALFTCSNCAICFTDRKPKHHAPRPIQLVARA